MIISSAVVQTHPQEVENLQQRLEAISGVEVHASTEKGQMVLTLEHETLTESADVFTKIQLMDGALSASLIFNQNEPEPESIYDPTQREESQ